LTNEELDKLEALAHALRSIAGNNQPHLRDNLSNEIDRLRELVANGGAREEIHSPQPDTLPPPCGICSDFSCQTRSVGAVCHLGTCVDNDRVCNRDGQVLCRCLPGVP
jgi:hypothetical protein